MNESNQYDGTGKLAEAIANLCGLSPKSQGQIAELIKQAKAGLGITSKSKNLPTDTKLAIWQWHYDRLHPTTVDDVEIISQPMQTDTVEIISHDGSNESVELYSHPTPPDSVEIISQPESPLPVEIISQYADTALVRVAFYIQRKGKRVRQAQVRQVIALDGFYVNALMFATGIDKKGVPAWVQSAVNGWAAFDGELPITRQVKFLIIQTITQALEEARKQQ